LAAALSVAIVSAGIAGAQGEPRPIDVERSTLTVLVYKSGLFSAFADDHVIRAPIAGGSISEAPLGVRLTVRSADLRVLDPGLAPDRRAEVQARMLGPEVLDVERFPEIVFTSTSIESSGADRWEAAGRLTIHGQTRLISFPVAFATGKYRGEVALKQRDFGIEPIRVFGGTVKVKDELKVRFEIAR
jgi:hypothetical protein